MSTKNQIEIIDREIDRKKIQQIKLKEEIYDLINEKLDLQYGKSTKNPNIFYIKE